MTSKTEVGPSERNRFKGWVLVVVGAVAIVLSYVSFGVLLEGTVFVLGLLEAIFFVLGLLLIFFGWKLLRKK